MGKRYRTFNAPSVDLNLYHWSPSTNRKQIQKLGLTPGRLARGDYPWRAPYVAFSDDPILAWALSGTYNPEIPSWDLWMVHTPNQTSFEGFEIITDTYPDTGRHYIKEYRVYTRIFKRDLHYVGSRHH